MGRLDFVCLRAGMKMRGASSLVFLGMIVLLVSAGLPMQGLAKSAARAPIVSAQGGVDSPVEPSKPSDPDAQKLKFMASSANLTRSSDVSSSSSSNSSSGNGVEDPSGSRTTERKPKEVQLVAPNYTKRLRVINETPISWNFTALYIEDPIPDTANAVEKARYRYEVEVAAGESYLFPHRVEKAGTYFIVIPARYVTVNNMEGIEFDSLNLDKHVVGVHSEVSVIFRSPAPEKPPALFYSDL